MGGNESVVRRNPNVGWGERIGCTKEPEWKMGGIGAFVRRKKSEELEGTERMYGAGRRKLYRLSENTL